MAINCALASAMCTEVANSDDVFGHYVGHDEPSMLFDSPVAGSGNHMRYNITLPTEPPASNPTELGKSYSFVVRSGRQPQLKVACLAPGSIKPGVGCHA